MKLEHVAIWTNQLEVLKAYYEEFFGGTSNSKYLNPKRNFSSYFISFESGARLELMSLPDLRVNENDPLSPYQGIIHLAFYVDSVEAVDAMAERLRAAGYPILNGPRRTGDGYYEFETFDPDQNRIEVGTPLNQ